MSSSQYVLDTFALMAFFNREAGHEKVREILRKGLLQQAQIFMSEINLGEFYYMTVKKLNRSHADQRLRYINRLRIRLMPATRQRIMAAAEFKIKYSTTRQQLSFADCFAGTLAQEINSELVTGDPEFKAIEAEVPIYWIKPV